MHIDWSKAPEGATHYMPKREESEWWRAVFWALDTSGKPVTAWAVDDDGTLEQYARPTWSEKDRVRLIPRPTTPQWSGEGLPPVGTVCEISASTEYQKISYPEGAKVKVYANFTDDRGVELAAFVDELGKVGGVAVAKCFRPIRSPEQIAAEERERAINGMVATAGLLDKGWCRKVCESLYDAGYRQIPDELAERVGQ